jgi:hypothetical protein
VRDSIKLLVGLRAVPARNAQDPADSLEEAEFAKGLSQEREPTSKRPQGSFRAAGKAQRHQSGSNPCQDLHGEVAGSIPAVTFPSQPDRERFRQPMMAARNAAAGINHHHERRINSKRREVIGAGLDDRPADCEDQEERSDEFTELLIHSRIPAEV